MTQAAIFQAEWNDYLTSDDITVRYMIEHTLKQESIEKVDEKYYFADKSYLQFNPYLGYIVPN